MRPFRIAPSLALGMLIAGAAPDLRACAIGDVSFLQGAWLSVRGDTRGEERWTLTAANTLAGSAWEANGSKVSFAELLSIQAGDDGLEMHLRHFDGGLNHAWEDKDSPMRFRLASCDGASAVFEGLGDKAGERITYRRSGEELVFIGDFLRQGKPFKVELHMQRAAQ